MGSELKWQQQQRGLGESQLELRCCSGSAEGLGSSRAAPAEAGLPAASGGRQPHRAFGEESAGAAGLLGLGRDPRISAHSSS